MPAEHPYSGEQDRGIEQLLPDAAHRGRERIGRGCDQCGPEYTARDPSANPEGAAPDAAARGQYDANDQCGLEDFAKDDDCGRQHCRLHYCTIRWPWVSEWKPSKNS
jgi:hypothetical protein